MKISSLIITLTLFLIGCSGGGGGGSAGGADGGCDGTCAKQILTASDVEQIVSQGVASASDAGVAATIAVIDRVGNVLALYQMPGAAQTTRVDGQRGATGGLEGVSVLSTLAAISKAGTGAYLSSQGNAFSTRTASQIIQENFNPGELHQPGGPLFGVQFSQLPCGDLLGQNIGVPGRGPKPLPLGLSADPGGFPLYKEGDVVGGIGIEFNGTYTLDRKITDRDSDLEEQVALNASVGFEAPAGRRADVIYVGGKTLRYADTTSNATSASSVQADFSHLVSEPPYFDGALRAGTQFGTPESGIVIGPNAAYLTTVGLRGGSSQAGGVQLTAGEVQALLDSAYATSLRARAAIRQPKDLSAEVSIFVVDVQGHPLGFVRSIDAPVFGIDVSLQKARAALLFSSDARSLLGSVGLGGYISAAQALTGDDFSGARAWSNRGIGNLARPFFPDGINENPNGPLSLPYSVWSPFNDGLQLDLVAGKFFAALGAKTALRSCSTGAMQTIGANGIQIFPGSVPLYRNGTLIGAIGVSGDGIDQDDLVAYYGASRSGLDYIGRTEVGDPELGFNAPRAIRADQFNTNVDNVRVRYVSCPEAPFSGSNEQNVCE